MRGDPTLVEWLHTTLEAPDADGRLKGEPIPMEIAILIHPAVGWTAIATYADGERRLGQGDYLDTQPAPPLPSAPALHDPAPDTEEGDD